jgi:hypothetical protein
MKTIEKQIEDEICPYLTECEKHEWATEDCVFNYEGCDRLEALKKLLPRIYVQYELKKMEGLGRHD